MLKLSFLASTSSSAEGEEEEERGADEDETREGTEVKVREAPSMVT